MRELRPVMVVWDEHPLFVLETGRDDSSARQGGFGGLWAWAMGTRVQLSLSLDDALGSFQLASNEIYFPVLVFLSLLFSLRFFCLSSKLLLYAKLSNEYRQNNKCMQP